MIINSTSLYIPFAPEVFHTIMTSVPYFGLRAYAGAQEHNWPGGAYVPMTGVPALVDVPEWHGAYGSEPTIEMYVWHTILVMRECWRVLRSDGVLFLNLGDSFATNPGNGRGGKTVDGGTPHRSAANKTGSGLPQGNLIGIPHRVMLALQADGWIVRNDNIWAKKVCIPESVNGWRYEPKRCECVVDRRGTEAYRKNAYGDAPQTDHAPDGSFTIPQANPDCELCGGTGYIGDPVLRQGSWRHTRSHEYVFMLTKQMGYYANAETVKEKPLQSSMARISEINFDNQTGGEKDYRNGTNRHRSARNALEGFSKNPTRNPRTTLRASIDQEAFYEFLRWMESDTNPKSTMTPSPSPWAGAHYAVFPPDLIAPLIRATTPARCCPHCGQAWAPVVEKGNAKHNGKTESAFPEGSSAKRVALLRQAARENGAEYQNNSRIIDYRQTCACPAHSPIPGIVFDPFFGSGTVGQMARELGLRYAGTDISFEYLSEQAILRVENKTPKGALDSLPLFQMIDR